MGWSIGFDEKWQRDIGYGVPAYCDHPGCGAEIDRGLSYVCGGQPFGGDDGCGLYFCSVHQYGAAQQCDHCFEETGKTFEPTPDHPLWIAHKATDESWAVWRKQQALGDADLSHGDEHE